MLIFFKSIFASIKPLLIKEKRNGVISIKPGEVKTIGDYGGQFEEFDLTAPGCLYGTILSLGRKRLNLIGICVAPCGKKPLNAILPHKRKEK